jgi:hypothetical protein
MASLLGCPTGVEGEVGDNNNRIHLGEEEKKIGCKERREIRVLMAEDSDTKLRIRRRLNF